MSNIPNTFRGLLALAALCAPAALAQNITGAGASLPNPIYSRWFAEYGRLHPETRINYQPIGSGAGIRQVSQGLVDFGATDDPMTDLQLSRSKVRLRHVPTVVGAVVPVYNLPGVSASLNFSPEVLARIYLGSITRWNDARLVADNPGTALPEQAIIPVYRADGSGTTYVFTDFLCKISPEFRERIGRETSVRWPVGVGGRGNEGVTGMVRSLPFSLGYAELAYALQNSVAFGSVRNAAGTWVKASTANVTAAASDLLPSMPADFRISITNAAGAQSYPIASFTWLLIPEKAADSAKARALSGFLAWMLATGETEGTNNMYAPLPPALAERVRASLLPLR